MEKNKDTFTIICYGKAKTYKESRRKALIKEFLEGMMCCDGSERDRYTNIYLDLIEGKKVCSDESFF